MNPEIEKFLNKKKAEELSKKKRAVLRAFQDGYDQLKDQYEPIVRRVVNKDGLYVFSFVEDPTEEETNALYNYFYPVKVSEVEKTYKVKNGWLTFIGVVLLIELIIGIIWAIAAL